MRIVLCGLNARYTHTNLAIRSLSAYGRAHGQSNIEWIWREWTINDHLLPLLSRLNEEEADVYAFSCYIWNRSLVASLSRELKKIRPHAILIWGGPEAGTQPLALLIKYAFIDFILCGEGEQSLTSLAGILASDLQPKDELLASVPGLAYRTKENQVRVNEPPLLLDGSEWPFPYEPTDLARDKERILYYESSRGCPYNCSYCLSSLDRTVRFRPMELVFDELDRFISADLKQVKFVDRTFNCSPDRAYQIWEHLIRRKKERWSSMQTIFHFELAGDLLDDESLKLLKEAPKDLFQFEIGVQSAHSDVLAEVNRKCDLKRLAAQVERLRKIGNCKVHLDLIAGLPSEDLMRFSRSFDFVCRLKPHTFQLGFLKVLPGTRICQIAEQRSYRWLDEPPYEVLQTDLLSFADLTLLKRIETLLNLYLNSRQNLSVTWLCRLWPRPWDFYTELSDYFLKHQLFDRSLGIEERLGWLYAFGKNRLAENQITMLRDLIRTDFLLSGQKGRPAWMGFWENSRDEDDRRALSHLRLDARRVLPKSMQSRLLFDRISFNWADFEQNEIWTESDWLLVYDGSTGPFRLIGQGPYSDGLPTFYVSAEAE